MTFPQQTLKSNNIYSIRVYRHYDFMIMRVRVMVFNATFNNISVI